MDMDTVDALDAVGLVLGPLLSASIAAWGYVIYGAATRKAGPLSGCDLPALPLPRSALLLGAVVLGLLLQQPAVDALLWLQGLPPPPSPDVTLTAVQWQCGVNLALTATLLGILGSAPGGLPAYGIQFRPLRMQFRDAILGFLLAIGPVFAVLVLSLLAGLRGEQPEHQLLQMLQEDGSLRNWFWISLTAVVAAPLTEELLFRVLLQGALLEMVPPAAAIAISAVLFCVVHQFPDSLALLPLAVVLGYVHYRRRSYFTLVLIHALFNGINLLLTALSSRG